MDKEAVAWLKELISRFHDAFPVNHPTVVLAGEQLAIGITDDDQPIWIGLPDAILTLPPGEIVARVVLENMARKGRHLDITFHPPALGHVEWNCTVCGITRLECKCPAGPSRF